MVRWMNRRRREGEFGGGQRFSKNDFDKGRCRSRFGGEAKEEVRGWVVVNGRRFPPLAQTTFSDRWQSYPTPPFLRNLEKKRKKRAKCDPEP